MPDVISKRSRILYTSRQTVRCKISGAGIAKLSNQCNHSNIELRYLYPLIIIFRTGNFISITFPWNFSVETMACFPRLFNHIVRLLVHGTSVFRLNFPSSLHWTLITKIRSSRELHAFYDILFQIAPIKALKRCVALGVVKSHLQVRIGFLAARPAIGGIEIPAFEQWIY